VGRGDGATNVGEHGHHGHSRRDAAGFIAPIKGGECSSSLKHAEPATHAPARENLLVTTQPRIWPGASTAAGHPSGTAPRRPCPPPLGELMGRSPGRHCPHSSPSTKYGAGGRSQLQWPPQSVSPMSRRLVRSVGFRCHVGLPKCRATRTMSAVPPNPLAGRPFHTATILLLSATMRSPAAKYPS
jgi:hypothetical protein